MDNQLSPWLKRLATVAIVSGACIGLSACESTNGGADVSGSQPQTCEVRGTPSFHAAGFGSLIAAGISDKANAEAIAVRVREMKVTDAFHIKDGQVTDPDGTVKYRVVLEPIANKDLPNFKVANVITKDTVTDEGIFENALNQWHEKSLYKSGTVKVTCENFN